MRLILLWTSLLLGLSCQSDSARKSAEPTSTDASLSIGFNPDSSEIVINTSSIPGLITQVARVDHRPYLHPLRTTDGRGVLTEYSPGHHKHQTGIYWGFTRVNGRDYFHHPEGTYWRKESAVILSNEEGSVKWQTQYHLLDETGNPIMLETQIWSVSLIETGYFLDLEWRGKAIQDITVSKYDYGGLFIRMPWRPDIKGQVVNSARQINERAEGQRATWVDVGMEIDNLEEWGHLTIMDHPHNADFPQHWRVDGQLGVGPAKSRMQDWTITEGDTEVIRHRIYCYQGDFDDVHLMEQWQNYSGNSSVYADAVLWGVAQEEGRQATFLTPQEAVDAMTVKDGFEVNVWASEPDITQPMAFCWDERGRIWVAENRDYESRGYGFSNSGDSRILILEDTDRDGVADSRKVFAEGIPFPAALAVGYDGVFVGAPPNLLFIPDRNRDDKADMADIEVRLTGWGIRDRHETLNSFHWGPDGWLYGTEGFATPSKVRKPKGKGRLFRSGEAFPTDLLEAEGVDINGGVWRYHPIDEVFEVVAHGFSNPWGIDYNAHGQMFITACVIPHMFHIINGGIYHRQGGKHFNPYVYEDIKTIVDHRHRSAHGGARIYQSDAFPEEYQGQLFMANIHEHAVLADKLLPNGSGYTASHGSDFLMANNAQWVGFSMEIGPDGGLYVLDWHDADICGKEVLHKETGRIFRVMPNVSQATAFPDRFVDLQNLSDDQLCDLQKSPSDWHARRARIILQGRAAQDKLAEQTKDRLKELFSQTIPDAHRLKLMWSLHVVDGWSSAELQELLQDDDEHIRSWAIQFLTEKKNPPQGICQSLVELATSETSPVVRLQLAAALQRISPFNAWSLAYELSKYATDSTDHNIPKMLWFGIEPLVVTDFEKAIRLATSTDIAHLSRCISRRLVDAGNLENVFLALDVGQDQVVPMLEGILQGLEGITSGQSPASWQKVYATLQREPKLKRLAEDIAQKFGDAEMAEKHLTTLRDPASSRENKVRAIKGLAAQQNEALPTYLPDYFADDDLGLASIQAVAAYEHRALGTELLKRYASLPPTLQSQVISAMASRPLYGAMITNALKSGDLTRRDIPVHIARQLRRVVGNGFVEVWGPIDLIATDLQATYDRYRRLLSKDDLLRADLAQGKQIFNKVCRSCHHLYGEGGDIGPDITGANRSDLEYLLSNLIEPSFDIQDDYKMTIVTTQDGRTYAGTVSVEDERQLTLRVVGSDPVVLSKSQISSQEQSDVSMMPNGLLGTLTDAEVTDLIAYLMTSEDRTDQLEID